VPLSLNQSAKPLDNYLIQRFGAAGAIAAQAYEAVRDGLGRHIRDAASAH
jgi:hypothetical protein